MYTLSTKWVSKNLNEFTEGGVMVFNATFNNISAQYIVAVSFISEGNRSTRKKPQTCRKSLTNFIT